MANYNKSVNFAVKDTLQAGDPQKIVSGAEIDTEFNNISSSSTTKIDKVPAAQTGNIAQFNATGGLADSGETVESVVPSGGIIMWSGLLTSIPSGWNLCDGSNGTPDLRNRFVVGAGDQYQRNDIGGSDTVQLTENQMPSHDHTMDSAGDHNHNGTNNTSQSGSVGTAIIDGAGIFQGPSGVFSVSNSSGKATEGSGANATSFKTLEFNDIHNHSIETDGDHTHNINNAGGDEAHENRPPYLALAYIMKL